MSTTWILQSKLMTDKRTEVRTDSPCVLQDFVPFGAAALLPLNLNHTLLKQGTGTADHLLPLVSEGEIDGGRTCRERFFLRQEFKFDLAFKPSFDVVNSFVSAATVNSN